MYEQLIPFNFFEVGHNSSETSLLWKKLNPEYQYKLWNDDDCLNLVHEINDIDVMKAYKRLNVGILRADVCRLAVLYVHGGIYIDSDVIPYGGHNKGIFKSIIPKNVTVVSTEYYSFEMIMTIPKHPFIKYALNRSVNNILTEINNCNTRNICCKGAHKCVIKITGPAAYFESIVNISKTLGCTNNRWIPSHQQCKNSTNWYVRNIFKCRDSGYRNNPYKTTFCGIARHADCRNSGISKDCEPNHYKNQKKFFKYDLDQ